MDEITPDDIQRAFTRVREFYAVQHTEDRTPEDVVTSGAYDALLESHGLSKDCLVVLNKNIREGFLDDEAPPKGAFTLAFIGLLVGLDAARGR